MTKAHVTMHLQLHFLCPYMTCPNDRVARTRPKALTFDLDIVDLEVSTKRLMGYCQYIPPK